MLKQNKVKTMTKHISSDCKCKFNSTTCNSNKKWNNETCRRERKNYRMCKKDYSWNPTTCICENSKCLKNITDTSVINVMKLYLLWICINKKDNNYSNKCYEYCFNKLSQ